jgi:hypothetical protein
LLGDAALGFVATALASFARLIHNEASGDADYTAVVPGLRRVRGTVAGRTAREPEK